MKAKRMKAKRKSTTVSIDEFCDFLNSEWGGYYMDDTDEATYDRHIRYESDKAVPVAPGTTITLSHFDGSIDWQGPGDPPADAPLTVREFFRRWQDKNQFDTLVFKVPKALADAVRKAVEPIINP
jgi:hypothetical protein